MHGDKKRELRIDKSNFLGSNMINQQGLMFKINNTGHLEGTNDNRLNGEG